MKKQYAFAIFAGLFLILAGAVISGSGKAGMRLQPRQSARQSKTFPCLTQTARRIL